MPRVPTYDNLQVTPTGLPQVRLNVPSAPGMAGQQAQQIGAATQQLGNQVAAIAADIQRKVGMAETMEAERELADWQMNALYNPDGGALGLRGKAASGIVKAMTERFDSEVQRLSGSFSLPAQRQAFQRLVQSRRAQMQMQLAAHERSESEAYVKGQLQGTLQTSLNAAALQFADSQAVEQEIRRSSGVLEAFGTLQGWSEEQTQAAIHAQISEMRSAVAERIIQEDPFRGVEYVQSNISQFQAAEGARLQKVATSTMESKLRLALAYEDRAQRIRQRQDQIIAKQVAMQGDVLLSQGKLSADWIESNRDRLTPQDYRYFYGELEGSQERTDLSVYAALRARIASGEDVSKEARESLQLGLLKPDDFKRLTEIQEFSSLSGEVPSVYKRGVQYIQNSLRVSELNPDPAAAQRQASALNDWDDYLKVNPKISEREAQQEYERIVEEYALADTRQMSLTKRMPRYAVGDRQNLDIDATAQRTVEAFRKKHGDDPDAMLADPEYQQQSRLIEEWKAIMTKAAAKRVGRPSNGERNGRQ